MLQPPLALYIHFPWCIRKCPYCDFNSHTLKGDLPEDQYIDALIQDLNAEKEKINGRSLVSIFMGGGTPSLFSAAALKRLLDHVFTLFPYHLDIEITLEANPGTFEAEKFAQFRHIGINRLSIGIQSFQADKLQALGRVHDDAQAFAAVHMAKQAGFDNINLDIMYGLPKQSIDDAFFDLNAALSLPVTHVSWYHLTLEPNTVFFNHPPKSLPKEKLLETIEHQGYAQLQQQQFYRYEISAYSKENKQAQHNRNYWEFGDYLGIGAGAHSKITMINNDIIRFNKHRVPNQYLLNDHKITQQRVLSTEDKIFEFMLNALRLTDGFSVNLFEDRTRLTYQHIEKYVQRAVDNALLDNKNKRIKPTEKGLLFLNELVNMFNME